MRKEKFWRVGLYGLGLLVLALGLTLNNKCALGTSAMSTTPYFATLVWGVPFGDGMFVFYLLCGAVQLVLKPRGEKAPVLGQLVVSLVLSRVLNWMDAVMGEPGSLWGKVLLLVGAVVFTGIGVALMLNAKLIPGAADGLVETLAQHFGADVGFTKNAADFVCMAVTFVLGLVTGHFFWAIGIGTLVGVVGVGRVISGFNRLWKDRLDLLMGLSQEKSQ